MALSPFDPRAAHLSSAHTSSDRNRAERLVGSKRLRADYRAAAGLVEFYARRKVLVTGADGFIGMNVVFALLALGADVTIITRRSSPRIADFTGRVVHGDLRNEAAVREATQDQSVILDLAGNSGAVRSNCRPAESLETECLPHLNLYQTCAALKPSPVVIFCSTRLVYGKPIRLPVDESHPINPGSMYAVHKLTVENYLRVFRQTHDLRSCVIRLSNPYGPYQAPETRNHGVINQFIRLAAQGKPITIFGDGRQERDYIYIADVVRTLLLMATVERCYGEIFNLGGRERISIIDTARKIAHLAGGTPIVLEPWPSEYLSVETGHYQTDLSKIDAIIPQSPQTLIDEGLKETLDICRVAIEEDSITTERVN